MKRSSIEKPRNTYGYSFGFSQSERSIFLPSQRHKIRTFIGDGYSMKYLREVLLILLIPFAANAQGTIEAVSPHLQIKPVLIHFDQLPKKTFATGIQRAFIMGTQSSFTRWQVAKGNVLPLHFHVNEQVTKVIQGELEVESQGETYTLHVGDVMIFPPNVPHKFTAKQDLVFDEFHTPGRQDYINGDFDKALKGYFSQKHVQN